MILFIKIKEFRNKWPTFNSKESKCLGNLQYKLQWANSLLPVTRVAVSTGDFLYTRANMFELRP